MGVDKKENTSEITSESSEKKHLFASIRGEVSNFYKKLTNKEQKDQDPPFEFMDDDTVAADSYHLSSDQELITTCSNVLSQDSDKIKLYTWDKYSKMVSQISIEWAPTWVWHSIKSYIIFSTPLDGNTTYLNFPWKMRDNQKDNINPRFVGAQYYDEWLKEKKYINNIDEKNPNTYTSIIYNNCIFDIPRLTWRINVKQTELKLVYNPNKTREYRKKLLEKREVDLTLAKIDWKDISWTYTPNWTTEKKNIKEDMMFTVKPSNNPIDYDTSFMKDIDIQTSLTQDITFDRHIEMQGEDTYIRKLILKTGDKSFSPLLDVKYQVNSETGSLELDTKNLKNQTITVNGFEFKKCTFTPKKDAKGQNTLDLDIQFDQQELESYRNHIMGSFIAVYNLVNKAELWDFKNLNKIEKWLWTYESAEKHHIDYTQIKWYWQLGLKPNSWESCNIRFNVDQNGNITLKDEYEQTWVTLPLNVMQAKEKAHYNISLENNKLVARLNSKSVEQYQYVSFSKDGKDLSWIRGFYKEWQGENGTNNFSLFDQSWVRISSFNLDYDQKTGYTFDKEKNKINLQAELFYDKIDNIQLAPWVSWYFDGNIKKYFKEEFDKLNLPPMAGVDYNGKFCSVDVSKDGRKVDFKEEYPDKVRQLVEKIKNICQAINMMTTLKVLGPDGKNITTRNGGANGYGRSFRIENFGENPNFICSVTNNQNQQDIKFKYQHNKFVLETESINITSTYKLKYNDKTNEIKMETTKE